ERDLALDLLHHLVNVAIQDRDGAEALQDRESLGAVLRSPAPFGVDRPQRNVREDNNRSAGADPGDIFAEPFQLLGSDGAEALQLRAVVQANEMNALVVEALPGLSGGRFAEALEIEFAVVAGDIVFAGDVEHILLPKAPEDLIERFEFGGLRK